MKQNDEQVFTGTLGECVKAIADVDRTPHQYYINFVQVELRDLLTSYDKLYSEDPYTRKTFKKIKDLLLKKIEIINNVL